MTYDQPALISGQALIDYFFAHVTPTNQDRIFKVAKPLYVFKKVLTVRSAEPAVANLIIPKGARVHASLDFHTPIGDMTRNEHKMRASEAFVHSIYTAWGPVNEMKKLRKARASHDWGFIYKPGEVVRPKNGFYPLAEACAPGIHFFLQVAQARNY